MALNALERAFQAFVRTFGCAVCRRLGWGPTPGEFHHVAQGSSIRSEFAGVCLCHEHHQGATGFHVLKEAEFCRRYRVPLGSELGMLAWTLEDVAGFFRRSIPKAKVL